MIIYVFNTVLEVIGLIEDYYSLTWAERYYVCGDFELELPITYDRSPLIEFGNFLHIASSDRLMIIEDVKPSSGEDMTKLIVQGESAESLLKRRILLAPITLAGNAEQLIYDLMTEHITAPSTATRQITLFKTTFPSVSMTEDFEDQLDRQTVYDAVETICKSAEYGFKIIKESTELAFSVYEGVDRSYDQIINPYVIFSDDFDNVIASSFYLSKKGLITTVYIVADDTFTNPTRWFMSTAGQPEPEDLDRFETVLESDVTKELEGEDPLLDADMMMILFTRAVAIIEEKKPVGVFEGDFDIQGNFKYGVDFFMGDIIQCKLEGRNVKARIIELVRSYSTEGNTSYVAMDFITTS